MEEATAGILGKLLEIQKGLKVAKERWNEFGGYYSRSKEDILEAVKPLAHERGCVVVCSDSVFAPCEGWVYCETVARLVDVETGEEVSARSHAREAADKKKLDASQLSGVACSYSGKRALGNLFAIDDTKDADELPPDAPGPFEAECTACGMRYRFDSVEQMEASACPCGNRQFRRA